MALGRFSQEDLHCLERDLFGDDRARSISDWFIRIKELRMKENAYDAASEAIKRVRFENNL